jgi:hypothetical protein
LENAAVLEDLRRRLAASESAAEAAAEEYAKQVKALQVRLEEALNEPIRMEEALHVKEEFIENLEIQVKELARAKRDQENIYEAEVSLPNDNRLIQTVSNLIFSLSLENCCATGKGGNA